MAKKLTAWDRMMDSKKDDQRTEGLDTFSKLSDEEVNLAHTTVSKKRLQEFIDLKLQCFDQLAGETDAKQRGERVKKIRELGESELSLAKGVGPKTLFQELAEEASRSAKLKIDQEKEKAEKKKYEEYKAAEEETRKRVEEYPQGMVRMAPPGMMLPSRMPGMRPSEMPRAMPDMVPNVTDRAMTQGQVSGTMGRMSPETLSGTFTVQQSYNAPSGAYMTGMPPMGIPQFPMMPHVVPDYRPCTLPHLMVTDQKAKKEEPVEAKDTKARSSREPHDSAIDQKLKLLTQLEATRIVLQNRPSGSESSTADEFRNRLRKINRLQMKVVDDILGSKGDLNLFDFVPELRPEKLEREKYDDSDTGTDVEEKEKEIEKEKRLKEPRKFVTLQLPEGSEADVRVVAAPTSRADSPRRGLCTGTSKLCSANKQLRPKDSWGRSKSVITTCDKIRMTGPDDSYPNYGPLCAQPPCMHYEQQLEFYTDSVPHYHNEPPIAQSPPQEVFYDTMPGAETALSFAPQKPQFFAQQHHSPVEFDIVLRGNWNYQENVNTVGTEADGGFSGDMYGASERQLVAPRNEPDLLSNTIILVSRPEAAVQTEAPVKKPARQQGQQGEPNISVKPVQARAVQVATVQVSATQLNTQPPPAPKAAQRSSSNDQRLAKICQEGLMRIAASVDDILNSLHSMPRDRPQRMTQRRHRDEDYDDDSSYNESDSYSDYDDIPPRRQKGRPGSRATERRRKSTGGKDDGGPSLCAWLYQGMCKKTSTSKVNQGDARLIQVANRIRELVQKVVYASNEVIEARKAIQQSGLLGQEGTQNVFAAEAKLWDLINLEGQLADGLAQYRMLDKSSDTAYFESLGQAEDKIRQLIEVETKLASEIGAWRQMTQQGPYSTSYTRTTMNGRPDSADSIATSGTASGVFSSSWRSDIRPN